MVRAQVDDPFVEILIIELPEDADDRQKVVQVNLLISQLLAIFEDIYEEWEAQQATNQQQPDDDQVARRRFNELMANHNL